MALFNDRRRGPGAGVADMVREKRLAGYTKAGPVPQDYKPEGGRVHPHREDDEPFAELSDEDYDRIYSKHEAQEAAGAAERQRIGQMKRQAHKAPDPDAPLKDALRQARQLRSLASKSRGRRR